MALTTIEKFATELKMPPGILLEQLSAAGVGGKKEGDKLSEQDKTRLLDYLRKQHGGLELKKKITLTRKQTTEIKSADSAGRARTIQVEVRKKRVFVKRDGADPAPPVEEVAPAQPVVTATELASREEEARKGAAVIAKQQEDVQQKQDQAKKRQTKKEKEAEEAAAKATADALQTKQNVIAGFLNRASQVQAAIGGHGASPAAPWQDGPALSLSGPAAANLDVEAPAGPRPDGGTHCVTEIACSARARSVSPGFALPSSAMGLSIAMNHCGVFRKITGFFERQECGY